MPACPICKNLNVVTNTDNHDHISVSWCRNCGWTSDGKEAPRLAGDLKNRGK